MKRDIILNGIHIGEHGFDPDEIIKEIKERCLGSGFNYVSIRPRGPEFDQKYFVQWADFLAKNQVFFSFNYLTQYPPRGLESRMFPETVAKVKAVAQGYFLGELHGEPGSSYACKLPGYYMMTQKDVRQIGGVEEALDPTKYRSIYTNYRLEKHTDMQQAHNAYVERFSKFTNINKRYGMPNILCVEATCFAKYNAEAGVDIPVLEMLPGNPESMIANVRGTAKASDCKMWGTFIAHEWYGGLRHTDMLKKKRLELAYKYAYLAGSKMMLLESGDTGVNSYGQQLDEDTDVCQNYKRVLREMAAYINEDVRPEGGPKVKVAFVSGLHDGWAGKWGRSCLWNQFYREEWGYSDAEHSWQLLEDIQTKRTWDDVANYGDTDTSGLPAYGLYDIVPIEADVDKLCGYDYLIFLGWNTMTEENMDKLTVYVQRGGHLVMSAAHLNTQIKRDGEYQMVSDEKVEQLFGCRFMGEVRRTVDGVNFKNESLDTRVLYPVYTSGGCDPLFAAGYADYARFAVTDGKTIAYSSDSFAERYSDLPMVIENKIGSGVATLVTHTCYPGAQSVYRLYRTVVREILSASARNCPVQVVCTDRVRYAVYEGGKMYLLNTDYDLPATAKVVYNGKEQVVDLKAMELKAIQL